jgi:hypothetical protein
MIRGGKCLKICQDKGGAFAKESKDFIIFPGSGNSLRQNFISSSYGEKLKLFSVKSPERADELSRQMAQSL